MRVDDPVFRLRFMNNTADKAWFEMGGDDAASVVPDDHVFALWEMRMDANGHRDSGEKPLHG